MCTRFGRYRICKYFFIVVIGYPFPHIAQHIVKPPGIRFLLANGTGSSTRKHGHGPGPGPGNIILSTCPCRIFPLKFRWQTVSMLFIQFIQLFDKCLGVFPADVFNRVLFGALFYQLFLKNRGVMLHYIFPLLLRYFKLSDKVGVVYPYCKARHSRFLSHFLGHFKS